VDTKSNPSEPRNRCHRERRCVPASGDVQPGHRPLGHPARGAGL